MTSTPLGSEAYEAAIRRNQAWNFGVNLADLSFFNLAVSFIYGSTVLSLYTSHLTTSALLIGLIPAIQNVGYFLPQLVTARYSERLARQKPFLLRISVMERLPYLFIGLTCLLYPEAPAAVSYAILAGGMAIANLSSGLGGPAWNHLLSKVIPVARRGIFFGLSSAIGGLLGVAGTMLSRHVLGTYAFPISFGICFLLCFACHVLSWSALSLNREPPLQPEAEAASMREYWRRLPGVLRADHNFCHYLVARSLIVLGGMGTALYIVYGKRTFAVTDTFAADLTMAALIVQTVSTPLLGMLADRRGNKLLSEISALLGAGALVLVLLAPNSLWLYPVFMLMNGALASMFVAGQGITLEFGGPGNLPTYVALANTLLSVPILVAPLLGGWLADTIGFGNLFVVALVFSLAGWAAMRFAVRDPRHANGTA
jgi:MFS family permease